MMQNIECGLINVVLIGGEQGYKFSNQILLKETTRAFGMNASKLNTDL
jgi:hypothetical protein